MERGIKWLFVAARMVAADKRDAWTSARSNFKGFVPAERHWQTNTFTVLGSRYGCFTHCLRFYCIFTSLEKVSAVWLMIFANGGTYEQINKQFEVRLLENE